MGVPDVIIGKEGKTTSTEFTDIDRALELTDHKWFHWKLLLICGLTFLSTGFEFTLQGYIQPVSQCDLGITAAKMGVISAVFLSGSLVSSLFWGVMADAVGRKKVLMFAVTLEGCFTVLTSWSSSPEIFSGIRFMCGFLCGGGATVTLSYVGEFCSNVKRPRNVCLMGFAWTMSWLLIPVLAAVVVPMTWELDVGFVVYKPWRLFIALVGVPNIISGILITIFLPESPKYYLSKGMEKESLEVLKMMYSKNTGNDPDTYPVTRLSLGNNIQDNKSTLEDSKKHDQTIRELCLQMFQQMKLLLRPPLLWNTLLSASIYVCGMFSYYGLGLWLPELFNRFEEFSKEHPNETVALCELSKNYFSNDTLTSEDICTATSVNFSMYTNTLILGAACFLGNLSVTYLATIIPARTVTTIFLELGAVCTFALYFIRISWLQVAVSAGLLSLVNGGLSIHNTCAINLFPTAVRGMGVCLSFFLGRMSAVLGSLVFGQLIDVYCEIPIFIVASVTCLGGLFALLIPKSSQKALE